MFVFGALKSLLPKFSGITVDNYAFRLHYRFTVIALISSLILATCKEFFGNPIRCHSVDGSIPSDVLDTFCWVQSTYSLPDLWHKQVGVDGEVIYPGVGGYRKGMPRVFHRYYQWVGFMLFLQAVCFYIPRYLWKTWEGGKVAMLILGLNKPCLDCKEKDSKISQLVEYISASMGSHKLYAACYIFCEMLNFVNIVGQIYLTDRFLGYEFSNYGVRVLQFIQMDQENRTDPMIEVFPRITKCDFLRYGFGANIENKDALCVLPLNIVNEKIYTFLWFWFILIAVITTINLIYRAITILYFKLRCFLLKNKARFISAEVIKNLVNGLEYGDWFLLYLLSKNLEGLQFKEFILKLQGSDPDKKAARRKAQAPAPPLLPFQRSKFEIA